MVFYFTYGSEGHPYVGGWAKVIAKDIETAKAAFRVYHPNRLGVLNCAGVYPKERFEATDTFKKGNFGAFLRETIYIGREVICDE